MNVAAFILNERKVSFTNSLIGGQYENMLIGWLFFAGFSCFFALVGSCLCVYWAPHAAGSGIPGLIANLNGIQSKGQFSLPTYFVRVLGSTFS